MRIQSFFDRDTATASHIVSDPASRRCAIIDPVLNYDLQSGRTSTQSIDQIISYVKNENLSVEWILETHIHADHLTGAHELKQRLGGKIGIGARITEALKYWVPLFDTVADTPMDGSQFDHLFKDGESFKIGTLKAKVLHTPGHTPTCISYVIGDAVFVGDVIFMPAVGTARADFPGGDAATLYRSIQKIFALPDETRIFTCHDYPLEGNAPAWESTVGEQKKKNTLINETVDEAQFVKARNDRDHGKPVPKLLLPALQVNLRAGSLGKPHANGVQYLHIPLNKI
jgi:glyoxylase-like metal-dependent hydrolase (beta-lactamase superfamily II)